MDLYDKKLSQLQRKQIFIHEQNKAFESIYEQKNFLKVVESFKQKFETELKLFLERLSKM
jgi:hypothetical protein